MKKAVQKIHSESELLPKAYGLPNGETRGLLTTWSPRVVFIEATNLCNLLCKTCVRTFLQREPLKSITLEEFVRIADQFPEMERSLLHGIGEPLLNHHLPQMIRTLKSLDVEVVINSNGTLLSRQWQKDLVQSGLDAFRCSIDGARPETYAFIRGADLLGKLLKGLKELVETRALLGVQHPDISIWCVANRENLDELPDLIPLAANLGVREVYLQRMTFFSQELDQQYGLAKQELSIFGSYVDRQEGIIKECERLSSELGVDFRASGARYPRNSLQAALSPDFAPWQACLRPWTSAYVTANGNCLPCCISPFSTHDYESLIMGNLFERPFSEIWNDSPYQQWRASLLSPTPHKACAGCGIYWSL